MKKDAIVIKQLFRKQLFLTISAILMVTVSYFVMRDDFIVGKIIGSIGILFFGAALFFIAKRLFVPKNILEIDENGFIDHSTAVSSGKMISWNNVESIEIKSVIGEQFICVEMKSPNEYINNLTFVQKYFSRMNRAMSYGSIQISLGSTNAKYDEVYQIMMEYWVSSHEN